VNAGRSAASDAYAMCNRMKQWNVV
jgi:hypothetical protein